MKPLFFNNVIELKGYMIKTSSEQSQCVIESLVVTAEPERLLDKHHIAGLIHLEIENEVGWDR